MKTVMHYIRKAVRKPWLKRVALLPLCVVCEAITPYAFFLGDLILAAMALVNSAPIYFCKVVCMLCCLHALLFACFVVCMLCCIYSFNAILPEMAITPAGDLEFRALKPISDIRLVT
jgi:hypothetical protein